MPTFGANSLVIPLNILSNNVGITHVDTSVDIHDGMNIVERPANIAVFGAILVAGILVLHVFDQAGIFQAIIDISPEIQILRHPDHTFGCYRLINLPVSRVCHSAVFVFRTQHVVLVDIPAPALSVDPFSLLIAEIHIKALVSQLVSRSSTRAFPLVANSNK